MPGLKIVITDGETETMYPLEKFADVEMTTEAGPATTEAATTEAPTTEAESTTAG